MTTPASKLNLDWVFRGIFGNLCPRCQTHSVFHHFVLMPQQCPGCGYVFERENGYFLGAMVVGYILGAFSTVPTIVVGIMILHAELWPVITVACLQVVALTPILFRYSRLAWLYLDYRTDPHTRT